MVVSFHPIYKSDLNLLCAGRDPGPKEVAAIRLAQAVILPQGCTQRLYQIARENCRNVFPNYDARFRYPGKTGQIRLFRKAGYPHPKTEIFRNTAEFRSHYPENWQGVFPVVFKFDWGGEGDTVFLLNSVAELEKMINQASRWETASGQSGFLLQECIAAGNRSLRVAKIGKRTLSYWRTHGDEEIFHASLAKGAKIDFSADPHLKEQGDNLAADFCRRTHINLAGLDVIFSVDGSLQTPLLLEINYFFGRAGLGGSEAYYGILRKEIRGWLASLGV
jgi:ribosomal protein S6--L-glutamate ligase